MKPKRIQRKRTKGWRMPPNTVYVGRPTKWGNPFTGIRLELSLSAYRDALIGIFDGPKFKELSDAEFHRIHLKYEAWRKRFYGIHRLNELRTELRGKDLACWCPLGCPCHADILLELANKDISLSGEKGRKE